MCLNEIKYNYLPLIMELLLICDLSDPKIELPTPIMASKVKVLDIMMPKSYINLQECHIQYFANGNWHQHLLKSGYYTIGNLLSHLNQMSSDIIFNINTPSKTVTIVCKCKRNKIGR